VLQRLNERREALREHQGSLVLVMAPTLKPMVRETAPDLWSIRSLALDLDTTEVPSISVPDLLPRRIPGLRTLEISPGIIGAAAPHARLAMKAMEAGHWAESVEEAEAAVSLSEQTSTAYTDALSLLAGIEFRASSFVAATRHSSRAIKTLERAIREHPNQARLFEGRLVHLNGLLGKAHAALDNPKQAARAFEEVIGWSRPRDDGTPDLDRAWLHADGLACLARMRRLVGATHEAESLAHEAISEARGLVSRGHRNAKALLASALFEHGTTAQTLGELPIALGAYEEALETLRAADVDGIGVGDLDRGLLLHLKARVAYDLSDIALAWPAAEQSVVLTREAARSDPSRRQMLALALGTFLIIAAHRDAPEPIGREVAEFLEIMDLLAVDEELLPTSAALLGQAVREVLVTLRQDIPLGTRLKLAAAGVDLWKQAQNAGVRSLSSYVQAAKMRGDAARLLVENGDTYAALIEINAGIADITKAPGMGPDAIDLTRALCELIEYRALLARKTQGWAQASMDLQQSISLREVVLGCMDTEQTRIELVSPMLRLGVTDAKQGKWARVVETLSEALTRIGATTSTNLPYSIWLELIRIECHIDRSRARLELGDPPGAQEDEELARDGLTVLKPQGLDEAERQELDFTNARLRELQEHLRTAADIHAPPQGASAT